MPIVELKAEIVTRQGQPMTDSGETITIRHIAFLALDTPLPDDANLGPAGKLRLARAGLKIAAAGDRVDLPSETVAMLLERAAGVMNALIYGQLVAALDPSQLA